MAPAALLADPSFSPRVRWTSGAMLRHKGEMQHIFHHSRVSLWGRSVWKQQREHHVRVALNVCSCEMKGVADVAQHDVSTDDWTSTASFSPMSSSSSTVSDAAPAASGDSSSSSSSSSSTDGTGGETMGPSNAIDKETVAMPGSAVEETSSSRGFSGQQALRSAEDGAREQLEGASGAAESVADVAGAAENVADMAGMFLSSVVGMVGVSLKKRQGDGFQVLQQQGRVETGRDGGEHLRRGRQQQQQQQQAGGGRRSNRIQKRRKEFEEESEATSSGSSRGDPEIEQAGSTRRGAASKIVRRVLGVPEQKQQRGQAAAAAGGGGGEAEGGRQRQKSSIAKKIREMTWSLQQSTAVEFTTVIFLTIFPVAVGTAVFFGVQTILHDMGPKPAEVIRPEPWWMIFGPAASAAGAFAGVAGLGLAAKAAAPTATVAVASSVVPGMEAAWRSFGGASLVALYWRTLVFGKTFRSVEWDLNSSETPNGCMRSITIRLPTLRAVRAKIALANGLSGPEEVQQLALWIPNIGDLIEPLAKAKDLALVPDFGFILWSRVPSDVLPFPVKAVHKLEPVPAAGHPAAETCQLNPASVVQQMLEIYSSAARTAQLAEASRAFASVHAIGDMDKDLGSRPCECEVFEELNSEVECVKIGDLMRVSTDPLPMTREEEDELIDRTIRRDEALITLFQAFGQNPQKFLRHSLYHLRKDMLVPRK